MMIKDPRPAPAIIIILRTVNVFEEGVVGSCMEAVSTIVNRRVPVVMSESCSKR